MPFVDFLPGLQSRRHHRHPRPSSPGFFPRREGRRLLLPRPPSVPTLNREMRVSSPLLRTARNASAAAVATKSAYSPPPPPTTRSVSVLRFGELDRQTEVSSSSPSSSSRPRWWSASLSLMLPLLPPPPTMPTTLLLLLLLTLVLIVVVVSLP